MFSPKIKIDKHLHQQAEEHAKKLGYSNLAEYVTHLIEKDIASADDGDREALARRLKGLGYL